MSNKLLFTIFFSCLALCGCTSTPTGHYGHGAQHRERAAGHHVSDGVIIAEVKAKLIAEKNFPSAHITVNCNNQVVHLRGVVHSAKIASKASDIAWSVKGVKDVVNHLEVRR